MSQNITGVLPCILGVGVEMLATRGATRETSLGRSQALLTARYRWLQWTHHRTQLKPSYWQCWENVVNKWQNATLQHCGKQSLRHLCQEKEEPQQARAEIPLYLEEITLDQGKAWRGRNGREGMLRSDPTALIPMRCLGQRFKEIGRREMKELGLGKRVGSTLLF